jgi:hypothetical protein
MIPTELIHGLIGFAAALLAARLGLPLPGKAPAADLSGVVKQVLLDLLKGLSQPAPAPEDEIKQHLQTIANAKKS